MTLGTNAGNLVIGSTYSSRGFKSASVLEAQPQVACLDFVCRVVVASKHGQDYLELRLERC